MTVNTPKIYIACLAAYNNGRLHGTWIDATDDLDAILDQVKTMLANSPEQDAEEYAIHDYDGFEGYYVSEGEFLSKVHDIACFIVEHGELGGQLLDRFNGDLDQTQTALEDYYVGEYSSVADFAQELTEETTDIPDNLVYYIDYGAMARDLEINDVFTIETGYEEVHIFWSH